MKFIDETVITVQAGSGGRGCVSFRREKYVPKGGPDGGDGGKGGDIIIESTTRLRTLYHFRYKHQFKAPNGSGGSGRQKSGRNGENLIIPVPIGTMVFDANTNALLFDFTKEGERFTAAPGGRGGQGNKRFATSTNRTPRFAQPGEEGPSAVLKLELKLLADIGIIGMPNAGKSTLISAISSARPKIADYPFTTLTPNLGVIHFSNHEPIIAADIPGLIPGAHEGAGLGIRFLKHIERTRILVHLIDVSTIEIENPLFGLNTVNQELSMHSTKLANKPQLIVLNKLDLPNVEDKKASFIGALPNQNVLCISAASGMGLRKLKSALISALAKLDQNPDSDNGLTPDDTIHHKHTNGYSHASG